MTEFKTTIKIEEYDVTIVVRDHQKFITCNGKRFSNLIKVTEYIYSLKDDGLI